MATANNFILDNETIYTIIEREEDELQFEIMLELFANLTISNH